MACILHLEAGPPGCSVAISKDGQLLGERLDLGREAAADLMVLSRELLESLGLSVQDISAVSVPAGPGSYTSLRTGYAMAKGLCASLRVPLICLSSLEILLHAAASSLSREFPEGGRVLCLMHARKNQFLGQQFDADDKKAWGGLREMGPEAPEDCRDSVLTIVDTPAETPLPQGLDGTVRIVQKKASDQTSPAWKRFAESEFDDLIQATPLYVYAPHITKPKPKFYN